MEGSTENSTSQQPMEVDPPTTKGNVVENVPKKEPNIKAKLSYRVLQFWIDELKLSKVESHKVTIKFMKLLTDRIVFSNIEDLNDIVKIIEM